MRGRLRSVSGMNYGMNCLIFTDAAGTLSTDSPQPDAPMSELADPHLIPRDHAAHWRALADHLRSTPESFEIARENLDRWEQWGRTHPAALREWRGKIQRAFSSPAAMNAFLDWLAQDNAGAEPLKSCSPFVGVRIVPSRP